MNMNRSVTVSSGIGLPGVLTIVFVILKALGYLTWSWWWVFSPLWISVSLGISILLIIGIILSILVLLER